MPKPKPRRGLETLGELEGGAWGGFLRTHARLLGEMNAELESAHGLELTSYDVLRQLALAPEGRLRMTDLAERVMLSRPGLSGTVRRLETAGLVERMRSPEDGRGVYATITAGGEHLLREAHGTHIQSIRSRFLSPLSEEELRLLTGVWAELGTRARLLT